MSILGNLIEKVKHAFDTDGSLPDEEKLAAARQEVFKTLAEASADGEITAEEMQQLRSLQSQLGISDVSMNAIKRKALKDLIDKILEDGIVTDDELQLMNSVTAGLELDEYEMDTMRPYFDRVDVLYAESQKALHPGYTEFKKGQELMLLGKPVEAIAAFDTAASQNADPAIKLNRALAYASAGQPGKALAELDALTADQPGLAEAWFNRGMLHYNSKVLDKAELDFKKAAEVDKGHYLAWTYIGIIDNETGRFDEAIAVLTRAIDAAPGYVPALMNRGMARLGTSDYVGAIADYRRAILEDPGFGELHNLLGLAYMGAGEPGNAIECFEQAMLKDKNNPEFLANLAIAQLLVGDTENADLNIKAALKRDPQNPKALAAQKQLSLAS